MSKFEEQVIKKIKGSIIAIKTGTKSPAEAGAGTLFIRLKEMNEPMYDELMQNYKMAIKIYKEKNPS